MNRESSPLPCLDLALAMAPMGDDREIYEEALYHFLLLIFLINEMTTALRVNDRATIRK